MKPKNQRRSLPLQSWQSDQWEVPIQNEHHASSRACRTIKLALLCTLPQPRRTGDAPGFRLRRIRDLPRLIRKLRLRQMAAGEGVS
jgi:hypothetical protein